MTYNENSYEAGGDDDPVPTAVSGSSPNKNAVEDEVS